MTEEIKGYPEGSVKTVHVELDSFKLNGKIGIGQTGKGVKISYEEGQFGKTWKIPEGKFKEAALKVPANKKLWGELEKAFEAYEDDDEQTFTVTSEKGAEYWNLTGIQVGEHGTQGVVKPGQEGVGSGGSSGGGGYNPSGAIIGKIENWALEITIANKTAKSKVTLEDILETLEGFDADLIKKINEEATKVYEAAYNGSGGSSKPEEPEQASDEDIEEGDDEDEDVPY